MNAFLFVPLLAGLTIVAVYVMAYAANCFLTVLEDTSAGLDRVRFPEEPVQDWLGRAVYLLFLVAVWLAPAGMAIRLFRNSLFPDNLLLRTLVIAGPVMWLLFPIGLLSALIGTSRWAILSPPVVVGLVRMLPSTLLYYASVLLVWMVGLGVWVLILWFQILAVPVAAAVSAAAFLIHARLTGRLAWQLSQIPSLWPESSSEEDLPKGPVTDPWAVPKASDGPALAVVPSDPDDEDTPRNSHISTARPLRVYEEEPADPYALSDEEPHARPGLTQAELYAAAAAEEEGSSSTRKKGRKRKRAGRRGTRLKHDVPALPLVSGIYSFPWYETTLSVWIALTCGCALLGGGGVVLLAVFPF